MNQPQDTAANKIRIIGRIRKMLALADDAAASEGERDNALRMAHATLAKHNLDMETVRSTPHAPQEARVIVQRKFYGRPWATAAVYAIADMCFCHYIITGAKQATQVTHWFIGKESNAVSAADLSEYVITNVWKEAHQRARAYGYGNEYARNFATGASATIRARCKALKESKNPTPDATPGTALVLASIYEREKSANQQLLADRKIETHERKSSARALHNHDALESGRAYGATVSLNRQVTGTTQRKLT